MRMARFVIKLTGYDEEAIHMENFLIDPPPPPPLISDKSPKRVTIRWKDQVFHFTVTYPMNILQAALNNGIQLPYSCRAGMCSTCTIKCVSGTVKLSINQVLTEKDLAKGLILSCVGYAETDVELEL
jgi:ring-1,2-phenylacetyl-CoA epoxidase subunit PaaE